MKITNYLKFAVLCLTAALSTGIAAAQVTPLKGTLEGTYTSVLDPGPPPVASVLGEGSGSATVLGRFTYQLPHIVDFGTQPPTGIGSYTFTAANGDQLFAQVTGFSTPVEPGILVVLEEAVVTGGTGRFSGAYGEFTVVRILIQAEGSTFGSFEGRIASPGAARNP